MSINLTGDPYNLQGGVAPLQGSPGTGLQGGVSPQVAYAPVPPVIHPRGEPVAAPAPKPSPAPAKPAAPARVVVAAPVAKPPVQVAQPDSQINSIFQPYIGSRPSPTNPGVLEYFNKLTGIGFSSAQDLYSFASTLGAGVVNSFDQLHAPVSGVRTQVQSVQPAPNPSQTIAQSAGTANLGFDEYTKILQQQSQLTPEELAQIRSGLGIDELAQSVFTPPTKNTVDLYNQAYGQAGLAEVKQKIQELNAKVNKAREAYVAVEGNINENPWLSEASRIGRIKRANEQAEAQISNYLDEQKQYQDLYQQGLTEVTNLVQRHTDDFNTTQELNGAKLNYLLAQAEQQAVAKLGQKTSQAFSYLPDYLNAKAKATAPSIISAGNGATFYYDKNSGTFVQLTQPQAQFESVTNPLTGEQTSFNKLTGTYGGGTGSGSVTVSIPQSTLAGRNNNPGNLRYVGQAGATQGQGGFAAFATPEAGYQALIADLQGKMTGNTRTGLGPNSTLADLIGKYAPPSENNTQQYIQQASATLGIPASTKLSQIDVNQLAQFIAKKESGTTITTNAAPSNSVIDSLVQQVTANPQLLATLPATQQSAVIARMAIQGLPVPNAKQLSGDAAKVKAIADTIVPEINQLKSAFQSNYKGALLGIVTGTNRELSKLVDTIADKVGRLRSGGAINDQEAANFRKQIASLNDLIFGNSDEAVSALNRLLDEASQVGSSIGGGVAPSGLQMPAGYGTSGGSNVDLSQFNFSF